MGDTVLSRRFRLSHRAFQIFGPVVGIKQQMMMNIDHVPSARVLAGEENLCDPSAGPGSPSFVDLDRTSAGKDEGAGSHRFFQRRQPSNWEPEDLDLVISVRPGAEMSSAGQKYRRCRPRLAGGGRLGHRANSHPAATLLTGCCQQASPKLRCVVKINERNQPYDHRRPDRNFDDHLV
jgi:hypothetical protein